MKVLSLFDGISCARVALERAGIPVEYYLASEIDKYAMQISAKNYPNITQVGSVVGLDTTRFTDIDLLIGGSPCQDLSIAKKDRKGLSGDRSGLFWEYVRILNEVKPKYFILENVNSMPKEAKQLITETLGVEPIMINAALVSAQNRKRLFWTNIPNITQPEDRGILLKDILEENVEEKYNVSLQHTQAMINTRKSKKLNIPDLDSKCGTITASYYKIPNDGNYIKRIGQIGKGGQGDRIYSPEGKSVGLSALGGGRGAKTGLYAVAGRVIGRKINERGVRDDYNPEIKTEQRFEVNENPEKTNTLSTVEKDNRILEDTVIRKLTPIECERLQSLPDGYTEGVSDTQRYKALGNAFNVEVVTHILRFIQ